MRNVRGIVGGILVLAVLAGVWWQRQSAPVAVSGGAPSPIEQPSALAPAPSSAPASAPSTAERARDAGEAARVRHPEIGFRSRERLVEHYRKHGAEFGSITQDEYLRLAQRLRDRPAGGTVLERVRRDGVITRFDQASGAFLAVNRDRTIRTFFRPNQGERYFWRQLER